MAGYVTSGSLEDRQGVIDVTVAYCWALDTRDWEALDEVFLADATASLGGEFVGLQAIKERVASALTPLDESHHVVSTHQVAVDGDRAKSRCYLIAQHVRHGASGSPNFIVAGRYEDSLVRTQSGWRIAHRTLTVTWTEGNPAVLFRDN